MAESLFAVRRCGATAARTVAAPIVSVLIAGALIATMPAHAQAQSPAVPAARPAPTPQLAPQAAADPALEARMLKIAEELRCLVCQNETIAASHADLAVDLRQQIRLKLHAGQTERQILDFMVQRYGEFVLYRPPLNPSTVLLWAGPFLLLVAGGVALTLTIRKRRRTLAAQSLSPEQARRARALLGQNEPS